MEHLLVFLPLIAAAFVGLTSRTINVHAAHWITTGALFISAILSGIMFYQVAILGEPRSIAVLEWMSIGGFKINWSLHIDALTSVMLVVVTWVSALVHLYSVGYMHHDPHQPRFFAYLSLFTFAMLMLVTADNFVQLFFGWEGVGLCSYLLIGFWYKKPSANAAAMKAFIVNRVGDFGLALGIFLIFKVFGTVNYAEVFAQVPNAVDQQIEFFGMQFHAITLICFLLFIGCMGKSAQLGLHTWLPDAMEGPTPVSALIHAATMVTAGVFLVARASPLFEYAPLTLDFIAVLGITTSLFAATIALTQNDIKRIIAYSTCSQLGYMFAACGLSAYDAGIFHLATHAFFKALLFLGAGSVIHAMSDEQDIRKMGGIWKKIWATYILMWIGSWALAGLPPFAGFFSKDAILITAYNTHNAVGEYVFYVGVLTAGMTAFYSWRLLLLAFHGKPRAPKSAMSHVHESPMVMLVPLILLSIGAIFSGWFGQEVLHAVHGDGSFWQHTLALPEAKHEGAAHHLPMWVMGVIAGGIALAYVFYLFLPQIPVFLASALRPLYLLSNRKWYIDEIYDLLIVKPVIYLAQISWRFVDVVIIDGLGPNGFAKVTSLFAGRLSKLQTGYMYHYAFAMLIGGVTLVGWLVYRMVL